ncbi:MAG: phosphoribosyltransferase family protein [Desulfonatronovibrio sp.]
MYIQSQTLIRGLRRFSDGYVRITGKRCCVCSAVIVRPAPGIILCPECSEKLRARRGGYCGMCARIYALEDESTYLCYDCRNLPFSWHGIAFFSVYQGLLKDIILRYKFNADLGLGKALGNFLAEAASLHPHEEFDCIVPVPLHYKRLRSRGFNQSLELARILGRRIGLPVLAEALIKTKHTPPQSSMNRKLRLKSLKKVFAVKGSQLENKKILLVDDIMTTGSTLEECTRSLLRAGAAEVRVLFLARAD